MRTASPEPVGIPLALRPDSVIMPLALASSMLAVCPDTPQ